MRLTDLASGYLKAEGYELETRSDTLLVGTRREVAGFNDFIHVWIAEDSDPAMYLSRQVTLKRQFAEASKVYPFGKKFLLTSSLEGFSPDFRHEAKQSYNVLVRVPAQFFDTGFNWEVSSVAPSASLALRQRGESAMRLRIPQPFMRQDDSTGPDLLGELLERVRGRRADSKSVNIVLGPAGIGKSMLFESLFAELYAKFSSDKRAQVPSVRPLPLLPEYGQAGTAPTIEALVNSFLQTDFARPLTPSVFSWLLLNGMATWLLDGLDEVIARDPGFFDYLLDLMTSPEQSVPPCAVVCVRDSLLATHEELQDFCESYPDHVQVYRLQPWSQESKGRFARLNLGHQSEQFLSALRSKPAIDHLASTPYYCRVLTDLFKEDQRLEMHDRHSLLRHALSKIIEREFQKELLDPALVREQEVQEFAEALALEDFGAASQGVPVDVVRELAEVVLPSGLDDGQIEKFVAHFTQIALVSSSPYGRIRFSQEVMGQFLLGLGLIRSFEQRPDAFRRHLAYQQIPYQWLTLGMIAEYIDQGSRFESLYPLMIEAVNQPDALRNLLQIAVFVRRRPETITPPDLSLERQDLSGMRFDRCSFRNASLRGCDLSDVTFVDCDLQDVVLDDAILRHTDFSQVDSSSLVGMRLGDLSRLYSIRVADGRDISEANEVQEWLQRAGGMASEIIEPCAAAQQLRYLLSKFVRSNGQVRRPWLSRHGVLSGRRIGDPRETLASTVRFGYLIEDNTRDRLIRPEGNLYAEVVNYVSHLTLTQGLRAVLSDLCQVPGCVHVRVIRAN